MKAIFPFFAAGMLLMAPCCCLTAADEQKKTESSSSSVLPATDEEMKGVPSASIYDAHAITERFTADTVFEKGEGIEILIPLTEKEASEMADEPSLVDRFGERRKALAEATSLQKDSSSAAITGKESADAAAVKAEEGKGQKAEFFINVTRDELFFALRCNASEGDIVEIIAEPHSGEFLGRADLHLVLDTSSGTLRSLSEQHLRGFDLSRQRKYSFSEEKGIRTITLRLSWQDFQHLTGDIPLSPDTKGIWDFRVFLWSGGKGYRWGSLPGTPNDKLLRLPAFSDRIIRGIRAKIFQEATTVYYKPGKDNKGIPLAKEYRLDVLLGFLKQVEPSHINYGLSRRQAFTFPFSTYYMIRDTEKLAEYREQKLKFARDAGVRVGENSIYARLLMASDYDRYADPDSEWEEMRRKAMRDHLFSTDFLEEWE